MDRSQWVMMSRIRNEERWIGRNLARAFRVCQTVVLWDDGSDDGTEGACFLALREAGGGGAASEITSSAWGWVGRASGPHGPCLLHYLTSPFRPAVREKQNVSEIRDKQALWEYVKAKVLFRHVLCLDGDEMLSRELLANFDKIDGTLEGGFDMIHLPFVYLWDDEHTRRVDGIYGFADDAIPRLRFPRIFTIIRQTDQQFFDQRFAWEGSKGGFHCGSIPREHFRPLNTDPQATVTRWPVIHFGYLHEADRQAKYIFYNAIDGGNTFEGEYRHVVGLPDVHAPGPVQLVPWEDE